MKIAIISEFTIPYYAGGGERRYYEYAKRLAKRHDVTWISMRQGNSPSEETREGIRFVHLGPRITKPPARNFIDFLRFEFALIWHLWTNKYDIVDAQAFSPLLGGWFATLFTRAKFVATIHDVTTPGNDQFLQNKGIAATVEKILFRLPYKRIVTVSDSVKKSLSEVYGVEKRKISVVHNGVTLEEVDVIPEQKKIRDLIYVGRLTPHKHVEDFLELCKRVNANGAIIGQGPLEKEIKQKIKRMKLKKVQFLGKLESYADVLKEIKKSRVLVLPSTREGFGMVLVEAAACQLPVVAYECNGVIDVVQQGKTGFLVPQRDIDAMTRATKKLLSSGSLRKKMGAAGRKRTEKNFTWDATVKKLEKVYTTMLKARR